MFMGVEPADASGLLDRFHTDVASMIAALGWAFLPTRSRSVTRRAVSTRNQVPGIAPAPTNLATEGLPILAMTLTDAVSPIGTLVNSLPHGSFLAKPSSNAFEPTPRLLQLRRGGRLIFQHDLLLEEVAEAFRFGCNPFADRSGG